MSASGKLCVCACACSVWVEGMGSLEGYKLMLKLCTPIYIHVTAVEVKF